MLEYWNIGEITNHQNIKRSNGQQGICEELRIQGSEASSTHNSIIPVFHHSILEA